MNLKRLIKAKKFDYVNPLIQQYDVLDLFPPEKVRGKDYYCIISVESKNYETAKLLIDAHCEPANLRELLLWPDWKAKDMVVALGSKCTIDGEEYVPCMECVYECTPKGCVNRSRLCLFNTKYTWPAGVLFLGIKT